ncbi:MAG: beta-ketoacyl-[acyl-carrier-protein] synthase family protein [Candidatus Adiutrix sp.]|jgi:3-oxoacyl-[acyl-carrier-protein] synthase-1/3-oxoacyl-[acyl-carrier-protein] synthase II|nr:beta-ketoacyl-[acyl-carrier-protein] synthase family protein [Candidatus Adiutrix sp.]
MEVWVTGLGGLCAAGRNIEEIWASLLAGRRAGPKPPARLLALTEFRNLEGLGHPAFSLPDDCFPEGFRHSARDSLDLAEAAGREALAQAGIAAAELAEGGGLIMGGTAGNALHFLKDYDALRRGAVSPGQGFVDFFEHNPAEGLARRWGLRLPTWTVGNACCSGADAVGLGLSLIRSGRFKRVLAGGADALSLTPYVGFRRLMIYSDEPCRPFDGRRQGLNLGEGAGALMLESADSAGARGARPLARLLAYAAASDAHHLTAPHPEARGLRRAIAAALGQAAVRPAELAFVKAHGTATRDNDRTEALAVNQEIPGTPLWALKGSTGHTLGAAGALETALGVTALNRGRLPASQGFQEADPELKLAPSGPLESLKGSAALCLSLGFGGGNSALLLGRA